jgi:hypothetical protein
MGENTDSAEVINGLVFRSVTKRWMREAAMNCTECGKELGPGDVYCPHCGGAQKEVGAPLEVPSEGTAPEQKTPPAGAGPAPAVPPATKPRKKWLIPLIAGIGVAVVVAIVLVLVLVVFKGSSPDKTVKQFFTEFENKNAVGIAALVDPQSFKQASGSEAAFKDLLKKNLPGGYVKFENLVFDTSIKGNEATVTLTKGTVQQKDKNGKIVSATVSEAGVQSTYYLVKRDGKWYFGKTTFPAFWAKYDLQKADKSLEKLKSDIDATGGDIDSFFSTLSQGVLSYQGLDQKFKGGSADFIDTLKGLSTKANVTKSLYTSVSQTNALEDFKKYAALREQQADDIIKMADAYQKDLKEFGDFTSNLAANPQTSPAVATQGLTAIQNKYTGEIQTLGTEYNSLDGEAQALKGQIGI